MPNEGPSPIRRRPRRRTIAPRTDIQTERRGHGGRRPAPAPRRVVVPRTDIQTERRGHGGRRVAAPAPRIPSARSRALAQERSYNSQGRAVKHAAAQQRRVAAFERKRRRRALRAPGALFDRNALRSERAAQDRAKRALAEWKASDPAGYDRRGRSGLDNAIRDVANTADKGLRSGAEWLKERSSSNARKDPTVRMGIAPDPSKLGREAVDIAANAPAGLYLAGAAVKESIGGDHDRSKKLLKDFKETSAIAAAVEGDWGEAAKRARERPLTTALELSGAKAVVGRGAGAAARVAPSKRVRQAGSTNRPNLQLYDPKTEGKGPEIQRRYSKDLINKGIQVAAERRTRKGSRVRRDGTQKRPGRDPHVDYGSRLVPAKGLTPGHDRPPIRQRLKRRADTRVATQQRAVEIITRERAREVRKAQKRGEDTSAVELAARADKVRDRLRSLVPDTKPAARKDIRKMLALDDDALLRKVDDAVKPPERRGPDRRTQDAKPREGGKFIANRRATSGRRYLDEAAAQRRDVASPTAGKRLGRDYLEGGKAIDDIKGGPANMPGLVAGAAVRGRPPTANPMMRELGELKVAPEELPQMAAQRAAREAGAENRVLIADEFGIAAGPRGFTRTARAARYFAVKRLQNPDLVPYKRADGEYVLVPKVVSDRFAAHAKVDEGPFRPGGGVDRATGTFKDVVLTTASPSRWLGGNLADITMRTAAAGITPLDIARGVKIDRRLRTEHGLQGKQASASTTGGGLYGTADDLAMVGGTRNPVKKTWRGYKRTIYTLEHAIEKVPQHGAVGKAMRQETARTRAGVKSLLKIEKEQLDRFAKGLGTDRAMEARIQKATEDVIGRWGKVSPAMRQTLSVAPFAQWLGAATRYVFVTLPVHHPIKTAILAGIMEMTEAERMRLGLSYFVPSAQRAPDYQMGMLPMNVGRNRYGPTVSGIRTARSTSFGTAAGFPANVPEFVLPQVSGLFNALTGHSFTGEQLMYAPEEGPDQEGTPVDMIDRIPIAAGAQAETMIPFAGAFRRSILEQGRPADPTSTILTPKVRPDFDYKTGTYSEPKGDIVKGLKKWALPYAPEGRLYTLGAQRDIERSRTTTITNKKWNERRKREGAQPKERDLFAPKPKTSRPKADERDIFGP